MTNLSVFQSAVATACEVPTASVPDYSERAPYHLAVICSEFSALDLAYRKAHGIDGECVITTASLPLADVFPLCDAFVPAVTYRLASMLTADENAELSEKLAGMCENALNELRNAIPSLAEAIRNVYPGLF